MAQPVDPMVYHITHVDNLPSIVADQCLWSDAEMMARGGPTATIGMTGIKQRRLRLPVAGRPGLMVGACVPFYFCPRSVMLFLLHKGNHPEVTYKGGQDPILHLEARLMDVVEWAGRCGVRWAFSLTNAGAAYKPFRTDVADLAQIDWNAVQSNDWRDPVVKEGKQAELLVERAFPFPLIRRIGVRTPATRHHAESCLGNSKHRPPVEIVPAWYY